MKLGRIVNLDERSRHFSIRRLAPVQQPKTTYWDCGLYLNQGLISACVGFSWIHFLASMPNQSKGFTETHAINLYHTAQTLDSLPGTAYEGTSILGGVKALRKLYPSVIEGYHWAFGLEELLVALSWIGPVVIGVNWYSGMFETDSKGELKISGVLIGGHAVLITGLNLEERSFVIHNSWGREWGSRGDCIISFDTMDKLLRQQGEACVATGKKALVL